MIDEALGKKVLEIFEKFENSIDGSDNWHESSAKGLLQYWECDGYSLCYWKNNGYQSILDILLVITIVSITLNNIGYQLTILFYFYRKNIQIQLKNFR